MMYNPTVAKIEVNPETRGVHANAELLACELADAQLMVQRYFLS